MWCSFRELCRIQLPAPANAHENVTLAASRLGNRAQDLIQAELVESRTLERVCSGTRTMSADLQDLHAAVEVGGADQCDAAALQGYGLHLHAVGYNGNGFVAGFMSDASLSPVLLKLQITHMQNNGGEARR